MTSHKERLEAVNRKDFSLPRNYNRNSQNRHSNSHTSNNESRRHNSKLKRSNSENYSEYQEPVSTDYINMKSEKVTFANGGTGKSENSVDTKALHSSQPRMGTNQYSTSQGYLSMHTPRSASKYFIYKSQSLNALKSKEPSRTLLKSSIQQEYQDKKVQRHLKKLSEGKSRTPCLIAAVMIICFFLSFIIGLTLICLTYIYKNINFSLDKGEMIGPVLMAGSFIFLGVGIRFIYDAYNISRKERKLIAYEGYDHRYAGFKHGRNAKLIANEKLVSGLATDIGLTRIPNKKKTISNDKNTLGKSNEYVYGNNIRNSFGRV